MRGTRRGGALLVAIALLALGSALLAGASAAARSATRAQVTLEAVMAAESAARVVLAESVDAWQAADDSLAVGASTVRAVDLRQSGFGSFAARSAVRIQRIDARRYAVVVSTRVGPDSAPRAQRRLRLLVERRAPDSSGRVLPPLPIGRWSMADLF